jgi:Ca-activated chloride channel family protein
MNQPTLLLSPIKSTVPAQGGSFDLLVRVQAPDQPTALSTPQVPKRLALVVDRSGSMSGKPLHEALRYVMHIALHLAPTDQLALVVYDTKVDVLRHLAPIGSADDLQAVLNGVDSGGSTNLHGGWLGGAQLLEGSDSASISRVLLLSDGQANAGLLDPPAIELQCGEWLKRGISTTTVGLGNSFNEDLMIGMARAGGGQQYYGQMAEDLYDSFDEELSLLQAMCLRQLDVTLMPAPGVTIEPLSTAQQNPDGSYRLSDLAWGAESWMALRLHLSPGAVGDARDLLSASLQACTMDGHTTTSSSGPLRLPVVSAQDHEQAVPDTTVARRLQEVEFAQASQKLRELGRLGDMKATMALMDALDQRFGQNPWLKDKLIGLRRMALEDSEMMVKEVSFLYRRMNSRSVATAEGLYVADETESNLPAFLRKKASEGRGRKQG